MSACGTEWWRRVRVVAATGCRSFFRSVLAPFAWRTLCGQSPHQKKVSLKGATNVTMRGRPQGLPPEFRFHHRHHRSPLTQRKRIHPRYGLSSNKNRVRQSLIRHRMVRPADFSNQPSKFTDRLSWSGSHSSRPRGRIFGGKHATSIGLMRKVEKFVVSYFPLARLSCIKNRFPCYATS